MHNGKAFEKFKEFVNAQDGDVAMIYDISLLPLSHCSQAYTSPKSGFISELYALEIGLASVELGAGRKDKTSKINMSAGINF